MKKKPYQLRLNEDLIIELKKQANHCNRSVNNFIETILKDFIKNDNRKVCDT